MTRRLIVRPEAEDDITDAAMWYESQEPNLGLEFISEIRAAIQRALNDPQAFSRLRAEPEVRRVLARRFPYRVFFIIRTDTLVVFAVLHAARHDRNWTHRLPDS
jgi:plasmid stabilization system protein ParE